MNSDMIQQHSFDTRLETLTDFLQAQKSALQQLGIRPTAGGA